MGRAAPLALVLAEEEEEVESPRGNNSRDTLASWGCFIQSHELCGGSDPLRLFQHRCRTRSRSWALSRAHARCARWARANPGLHLRCCSARRGNALPGGDGGDGALPGGRYAMVVPSDGWLRSGTRVAYSQLCPQGTRQYCQQKNDSFLPNSFAVRTRG